MTHLPANLPSVVTAASPFVSQYGYLGIALLLFLESACIPIPGETTLIIAALFAGIGKLNILLVILTAIAASAIGDNLAFLVGSLIGRSVIEKYGKYILMPPKRFEKFEKYFNNNGPKIVLVARFIEVLRQLNGLIAGIGEMSWRTFLLFNLIGATLWVGVWSSIGYFAGNHIQLFLKYQLYISIIVGALVIIYIIRKVIINISKHHLPSKE